MKKSIKGSLLFFVLIVFSGSIFAYANFGVTVGEIFTYEVVTSQWSLVQDLDSGQGSGLKYGGNPFPIGTQFTIEILAASSSSINWEIDIDGNTAINNNDAGDVADMTEFLYLPFAFTSGFGTWDQGEVEMGPAIMMGIFFLEPTAFIDFFQALHNQASTSSFDPSTYWVYNNVDANFDSSGTIAIFDWVHNAQYNDSGCNTYLSGTYYATIAFDKTTGVLKGYNLDLDYFGDVAGDTFQIDMQQNIEQVGYNIDGFYFTAPGFGWLTVFPALLVVSYFGFLLRKRKKLLR
ncbi:MAG: hypothetical protein GPJ52_02230 [Candidatus Heimdallarchaeota archaeon]|nr:hypothetical protein [Candidatus Heimdallarchaeota archaeon]MCG3254401.1 hypothetical protein [Candidatus Heimdallarchaeota archaeon]MCK4291526.1 hypothetical protein [Candidatus Heimdallarchaeota archaeon]